MKINEQITLDLVLPSPSDTTPVWSISDPAVASLVVDEGAYKATVTALKAGHVDVSAVANCDLGSGVRQHNTVFNLDVEDDGAAPVVIEDSVEEDTPYWKNPDGN